MSKIDYFEFVAMKELSHDHLAFDSWLERNNADPKHEDVPVTTYHFRRYWKDPSGRRIAIGINTFDGLRALVLRDLAAKTFEEDLEELLELSQAIGMDIEAGSEPEDLELLEKLRKRFIEKHEWPEGNE